MVRHVTRWLPFLALAFVVSPFGGLVVAIGLAMAGGDIGAILALLLLPALVTLLAAIRTDRPSWAVAALPLVSGVIAVAAGWLVLAFLEERPFD